MKHPITKFPVEPYEAITEEFVQRKYYEYNQLYFAGELPPCKFRFNAMSLYYVNMCVLLDTINDFMIMTFIK